MAKIVSSENYDKRKYPLQAETYILNGIAMEIHRILGRGFLEIVYKDALEFELRKKGIPFEREKEYCVEYKEITLPHKFFADFVVHNDVIVEIKAQSGIVDEHKKEAKPKTALRSVKKVFQRKAS